MLVRLCAAFAALAGAAAKAPHLVFVLVDDLGFNDGHDSSDIGSIAWPKTNALANEGLRIEHYYTQPICTPTRGALMSGRYPARLGLSHQVIQGYQNYGLPLDEVTLADKLRSSGYKTYATGKWHLGCYSFASTPTYRGFDRYFGYWNGAEDYTTHEIGGYLDLHRQNGTAHVQAADARGKYSTPIFAADVIDALQTHKRDFPDAPGFFYFPLQNVHAPMESPGGEYDAVCAGVSDTGRQTFCAMAAIADDAIGNVTDALSRLYADEDFLVVIAGDNGGIAQWSGNNAPLRGQKGTLWEGGVRNNALVWGSLLPKSARGSTYSDGLVHVTDWHATFAALGGATLAGVHCLQPLRQTLTLLPPPTVEVVHCLPRMRAAADVSRAFFLCECRAFPSRPRRQRWTEWTCGAQSPPRHPTSRRPARGRSSS